MHAQQKLLHIVQTGKTGHDACCHACSAFMAAMPFKLPAVAPLKANLCLLSMMVSLRNYVAVAMTE